jgi:hypothetical protein
MQLIDLSGAWLCEIPGQSKMILLPGTLDEGRVGSPDTGSNQWHPDAGVNNSMDQGGPIATRLTRHYTYEGPAILTRRLDFDMPEGKRVFLEAERARCLSLQVNGQPVPDFIPPTISTPHVFEVTGLLTGQDEFRLILDNSYPGLPHDDIVYSSAATDETQTNWNGVLGAFRLRVEGPVFFSVLRAYPHGDMLDVCMEISADRAFRGQVTVTSQALIQQAQIQADAQPGTNQIWIRDLKLRTDVRHWDEAEGRLYDLTVSSDGLDSRTVSFGVRDFGASADGKLTLNGRTIFLRSEANCAVFPETGHPPMDAAAWESILRAYASYGVNCMRFHSHVPPDAAFTAADRMGILMQPELSHWNPRNALETDESWRYYRTELEQVVLHLSNHPSFVMMTFGNELATGALGHSRMDQLLAIARSLDGTRLFANASNGHYGNMGCDAKSDFFASQSYYDHRLRATSANMEGTLNHQYPSAQSDYDAPMAELRKTYSGPVFTFEVGQYEVLPDFHELADFCGVTKPDNLELIRSRMEERGLDGEWTRRVEATGELALLCYREEIEAVLRTQSLSGISLLGLQDFPGQGTALVGMLNSHLKPKPYDFARPERFRSFFTGCLPLVLLPRYTYEAGERLTAHVRMANYGKTLLTGRLHYELRGECFCLSGELPEAAAPVGNLQDIGLLDLPLDGLSRPQRMELAVDFCGKANSYPIWVYPPVEPVCPGAVHEAVLLDEEAERILAGDGRVFLAPPSTKEHLPSSIQAQFSTDFWSVGTFAGQEGGMGQLIDAEHPLFKAFPTQSHTDWQWWPMAGQRAVILPQKIRAIVTEMDSYAYMRPMAQLFEGRCGGGRIMVSTMGLKELARYPEARALLAAIYGYMASDDFSPEQELTTDMLRSLIR